MKNRKIQNTTIVPGSGDQNTQRQPSPFESYMMDVPFESYMGMLGGALVETVQDRYNKIPFKNKAINLFDKKRYDISREFDGKNVEGTMTVRPTIGGGMVETERYNIPDAGTVRTKTRFDKEGNKVREVKVNNSNNNVSRFLNKENWKRKKQDVPFPGESGYIVGSERPTLSGGKVKRSNQKITYTEGPRAGTTEIIKSRTTI